MLHIAPHHTHSRATKEKEPPTGWEIGRRVARERERVRESSWWMLQILGEKREEGEKKLMIKKWKFVYVSVEQLVIVSAWSDPPFSTFFLFIFTYWNWWFPRILRLESDWFIGALRDDLSARLREKCRGVVSKRCDASNSRAMHISRRQSAIEISAAMK